ncbi:MAG: aminotransferase class I/II-fold pyridoxal phosphate-dependent enzyme, partial [Chlorobi bacterium]|nr:aminotransferase class I/II-fold pyridoxal phosphate-dependent enzyme [Chlorobiota bacterium]NOG68639.1 aminotransferase class I/II-fold pyridoxal phosphate-dependent enzyme [Chlorobiota bacterium]
FCNDYDSISQSEFFFFFNQKSPYEFCACLVASETCIEDGLGAADADPGVTCYKPQAALYLFPRLDPKMYPIADDQQFILELLLEEKVLLVQGSGFNWPNPDHFRVVFLPNADDLREAIGRVARFLEHYRKRHGN